MFIRLTILVGALCAGGAQAQQGPDGGRQAVVSDSAATVEAIALNSPEDLEGVKIVDESGKALGEVQDVVLKRGTSDVYLVMSSDSFFGFGAEDVVISIRDVAIAGEDMLRLRSLEAVELYLPEDYLEVEVAD